MNNVRWSFSLNNIRPHLLMQSLGGGGKLKASAEVTTKAAAENGGNNSSPRANSFRSCNASPSQVSYKLIVFSNWISNSSNFFNSSFLIGFDVFQMTLNDTNLVIDSNPQYSSLNNSTGLSISQPFNRQRSRLPQVEIVSHSWERTATNKKSREKVCQ